MIEIVNSDEEVANLYKVGQNAPYRPVPGGYGYYGVLIRHASTGKMKCHVCGKWCKSLGAHITRNRDHRMSGDEYKARFGFSKHQPLCWVALSKRRSEVGRRKKHLAKLAKNRHTGGHKRKRGKASLSFRNDHATCTDQLYQRYLAVADQVGHDPTEADIRQHDARLLDSIKYHYEGKINLFRKEHNLKVTRSTNSRKYRIARLLLILRQRARKLGRLPKPKDFRASTPSATIYYRRFGSWSRALSDAGLVE